MSHDTASHGARHAQATRTIFKSNDVQKPRIRDSIIQEASGWMKVIVETEQLTRFELEELWVITGNMLANTFQQTADNLGSNAGNLFRRKKRRLEDCCESHPRLKLLCSSTSPSRTLFISAAASTNPLLRKLMLMTSCLDTFSHPSIEPSVLLASVECFVEESKGVTFAEQVTWANSILSTHQPDPASFMEVRLHSVRPKAPVRWFAPVVYDNRIVTRAQHCVVLSIAKAIPTLRQVVVDHLNSWSGASKAMQVQTILKFAAAYIPSFNVGSYCVELARGCCDTASVHITTCCEVAECILAVVRSTNRQHNLLNAGGAVMEQLALMSTQLCCKWLTHRIDASQRQILFEACYATLLHSRPALLTSIRIELIQISYCLSQQENCSPMLSLLHKLITFIDS